MRGHRLRKTRANGARTTHASVRKWAGLFLPTSRGLPNTEPLTFGKGRALCCGRSQVPSKPSLNWPWAREVPTRRKGDIFARGLYRWTSRRGRDPAGRLFSEARWHDGLCCDRRGPDRNADRGASARGALSSAAQGLTGSPGGGAWRQGAGPAPPHPPTLQVADRAASEALHGSPRGGASSRPRRRWERLGWLCW